MVLALFSLSLSFPLYSVHNSRHATVSIFVFGLFMCVCFLFAVHELTVFIEILNLISLFWFCCICSFFHNFSFIIFSVSFHYYCLHYARDNGIFRRSSTSYFLTIFLLLCGIRLIFGDDAHPRIQFQ